jgi:ABC-type branched-subunit amino acid transport system substrate-binding protein
MLRRQLLQAATVGALPLFAHAQDTTPLVVAHIGPFTVLPAPDAKELHEGALAAFADLNAKGGIAGRKVELLRLDDTYTFDGFKARLAEALPRKPLALLSPLGSATLKQVLDTKLLDSTDIVLINAVPGAAVLRDPGHPKLFHVRAGDEQQIRKIVAHARALNIQSMGVLYQNIPIGSSGLASAEAAARGIGLEVIGVSSGTALPELTQAAQQIASRNPHSVLVIGAPRFMGQGVAALRAAGVTQQLFALSYLPAPALQAMAGPGARGVGIAQTFPNPNGVSSVLQRGFRAAMQKAQPDLKVYTPFHLEGYVTAQVFAQAARQARNLTPSGIAEALRRMGEFDLGGFRVDFSKGNEGSSWVDIGVSSADGRLLY